MNPAMINKNFKFHNKYRTENKIMCKSEERNHSITYENNLIIFNDGTPIDWLIAKKKLRRKLKANDCWDLINEESNAAIIPESPGTYEDYYKLELYKNKDIIFKAKEKARLKQNVEEYAFQNSNKNNKNKVNKQSNKNTNIQDEKDNNSIDAIPTDFDEVEMLE